MKKEYRLPDEKRVDRISSCASFFCYVYVVLHLLLLAIYYSKMWIMLAALGYPLLLWFDEFVYTNYVIIEEDKLTIRSRGLSSWFREYRYNDIDEVRFLGGRHYYFPYIQVRLKTGKKSRNFSIKEMIDPSRYQELVDDLRAKGVRVTLKKMKGVV